MSGNMMIDVYNEVDHVVLRPRGHLCLDNVFQVHEATVKSLLGIGRVLIDLSRLRSPQRGCITVFTTALTAAGSWSVARLVLFGADSIMRAMLISARITETVHLAADLPSAYALLEQRPALVQRRRDLPVHRTAPAAARLLVREACTACSLTAAVREVAEIVSNELVTNAVEHARTASEIMITCTESVLLIAVRDYSPTDPPRPRPLDINAPRGRGLHLVAALAQTWGVQQHSDGKTMWASLSLD